MFLRPSAALHKSATELLAGMPSFERRFTADGKACIVGAEKMHSQSPELRASMICKRMASAKMKMRDKNDRGIAT
jgi:hypothetical protein